MQKTKDQDAYGHELWDFYHKRSAYEIIERDDGYIRESAGPKFYFSSYKKWHKIEKQALKFAKGRVLDVGCGAARVAIYLQNEKKLDVLGIDNSPLAIEVSRLRGLKKTRLLDFHEIDFAPASFDTIVLFGANFGLFSSMRIAKILLKKLFVMTSEDAVIICQSLDPYNTDDPDHLSYQKQNKKSNKMGGQVRIRARYRTFIGSWFDYLLVSQEEMESIVDGTGWRIDRFFNASERPAYIALIRKEKKS